MNSQSLVSRIVFGVVVAVTAVGYQSSCPASIVLGDLVGGAINRLEDDDFEGAALLDNGTTLEVGDALYGVFFIQALHAPVTTTAQANPIAGHLGAGPGTTFAGAFVTEVVSKAGGGGPSSWTFGPATSVANIGLWTTLGYAPSDAGTMVAVFQDSSDPSISISDPTSGTDGIPLFEFGFNGTAGEFWMANGPTDDPTALGTSSIGFSTSMSLTANFTTQGFDPFTISSFTTALQIHGIGSVSFDPVSAAAGDFPLFSDTDFWVQPTIPEPTSILVWFGISMVCMSVRRR
jgi:hypothetical protein